MVTVNPVGYVSVADGGVPRSFGGKAFEYISGGQFVFCSGAADAVSSGADSFVQSDIGIAHASAGSQINGIAMQSAASGADVSVVRKADVIVMAANTVTCGMPVKYVQDGGVADMATTGSDVPVTQITQDMKIRPIGRAMTSATSGLYALISLDL
jgi:hypothetical protein